VTRAVMAFAPVCPDSGPELVDLPGAAFVGMYQAVTPELAGELDALVRDWDAWLPAVGEWTPASGQTPPTRPVSPAHDHVLKTVDAWWCFWHDRMRQDVVQMLTGAGGEVVADSINVGPDGQLIEGTRIEFPAQASVGASSGRRLKTVYERGCAVAATTSVVMCPLVDGVAACRTTFRDSRAV
jgi:hypothetical protein